MKKIIPLVLLLLIFSCKPASQVTSNTKTDTISASEVKAIVSFLASDELKGRDTGSEGINAAAYFIENKFKTYGIQPYFSTYRDTFQVGELDAYNVVGYLEGNDKILKDQFVIVGAHYDHIGLRKTTETDSIANGANDNAAGTAGVLAMAKYFASKKNNKRSLLFVLFSAEEKGLEGSKHLAKKLKEQNLDLYTMFNIEMIGVPMKDKTYEAYLTGHKLSNMSEKMNTYSNDQNFIGFYEMAETYELFKRSDNHPFYLEFNIPAQTISTSDDYIHYHQVGDEIDKLDYNHMANMINKIIPAIEQMNNSATKEIKMYE
jgi:Zn-dependent M28 family amino/carboxypeptidase